MPRVHVVSFCNLIGTARARRRKLTTFPADVTRLSPPPVFEERAWGRGYSTPTIKVHLSAVGSHHHRQGFKDPTHHNLQLKMVLRGTQQANLDRTSHPRQPITRAVLHRLLYQVRYSRKLHKHDKHMLTAAFLLAFFGFLRVSEFTIPSRSRFNPRTHPTKASVSCKRKYYAFTIKASKTNQLHPGHKIYILRSHETICPYSVMQKYIGHFPHSPAVGAQPLFTFRDGSPLTRHSCLKHLRRSLHKAGYSRLSNWCCYVSSPLRPASAPDQTVG